MKTDTLRMVEAILKTPGLLEDLAEIVNDPYKPPEGAPLFVFELCRDAFRDPKAFEQLGVEPLAHPERVRWDVIAMLLTREQPKEHRMVMGRCAVVWLDEEDSKLYEPPAA